MGIGPETASPLVTKGRGTGLGTRLLQGLVAPLMLRSASAADTCRMPQHRLNAKFLPGRDRHAVSLLLRNHFGRC